MRGTVDEWLRARSTVRSLGRTKQRPKNPNAYPWLVNGATTPEQLRRHRAAIERLLCIKGSSGDDAGGGKVV